MGSGELREREWDQSQGVTAVCGAILLVQMLLGDQLVLEPRKRAQSWSSHGSSGLMNITWMTATPSKGNAWTTRILCLGARAKNQRTGACQDLSQPLLWETVKRNGLEHGLQIQFMLETGCYPLLSCVTSDELLNFSVLQLFTLNWWSKMGVIIVPTLGRLQRLSDLIYTKYLE